MSEPFTIDYLGGEYETDHRDSTITAMLRHEHHYYIGAFGVVIVTLDDPKGWFIVPRFFRDEDAMEDIGPFDTPDDAFFHMRLYSTDIRDPYDDR